MTQAPDAAALIEAVYAMAANKEAADDFLSRFTGERLPDLKQVRAAAILRDWRNGMSVSRLRWKYNLARSTAYWYSKKGRAQKENSSNDQPTS